MTHSKLVLLSTALLVMGAGVVVGRLSDRLPEQAISRQPQQQQHSRSWLDDQLNLTPDQRQKMDAIWIETRQNVDKVFESRRGLEKDRDQAIQNLLGPQAWAAYGQVIADYRAKSDEYFKARTKLVQDANDASRALLDADQQKKWEVLTREMRERRGPARPGSERGPGSGPGPGMGLGPPGDRPHHDRSGDRSSMDKSTTRPSGSAEKDHAGADGNRA